MHRIAVVLAIAACSKGRPDDCAIVRDKPAEAMVELSKRYPNNPVKVAQTIENCVAPSGDECERVSKIVIAIPTMAPQIALPASAGSAADVARMCQAAPPDFRRCLLPSYGLAHADECRDMLTKPITTFEITPSARTSEDNDCGYVSIYINEKGSWLATGRDANARCYAPRKGGALDWDWLEAQLRKAKEHPCGPVAAELAASGDVPYQELINAMDIAIKTGFIDTGLSSLEGVTAALASATVKGAASECPPTLIEPDANSARDPKDAVKPPATASASDTLAKAPVLIVTKSELTLSANGTSTDIATLAAARTAPKLDALIKALPPTRDGLLILQADESTPAQVINVVVATAKAAGYDNVMFAVKNR